MSDTTIAHRAKIFGSILRRIDHHAALLGAGHAANYERNEFGEHDLENTFNTLQVLDALVQEAKEKIAYIEPTQLEPNGRLHPTT